LAGRAVVVRRADRSARARAPGTVLPAPPVAFTRRSCRRPDSPKTVGLRRRAVDDMKRRVLVSASHPPADRKSMRLTPASPLLSSLLLASSLRDLCRGRRGDVIVTARSKRFRHSPKNESTKRPPGCDDPPGSRPLIRRWPGPDWHDARWETRPSRIRGRCRRQCRPWPVRTSSVPESK